MADINTTMATEILEQGFDWTSPPVLATGAVLLLSVLLLVSKNKNSLPSRWPHVPYTIPWVGNLLQLGGVMHVVTKIEEWAVKYGKEYGIFRITLGGVEYIVLCREEETLEIERQRPFKVIRDSMMTSAVKSVGGYGLFATEGEEWKQDKRLTSPALNHASVAKYFETMKVMSKRLTDLWNKELEEKKQQHYGQGD